MKAETLRSSTEGAIWARIVRPTDGSLTLARARSFLEMDFSPEDRERMNELAEKARAATLTARESKDADTYNRVAHLLALLHSKARLSLRGRKQV